MPTPIDPGELRAQNIKNLFVFVVLMSLIGAFTASHLVELNLDNKHVKAITEHHCDDCLFKLFPRFKKKSQVEIKISPPKLPNTTIK